MAGRLVLLDYILNSGSSSSLSELKNLRLFFGALAGPSLPPLPPAGAAFRPLLDPTLATLLLEDARDRERPLGGFVGASAGTFSAWEAPSDSSTCEYTEESYFCGQ